MRRATTFLFVLLLLCSPALFAQTYRWAGYIAIGDDFQKVKSDLSAMTTMNYPPLSCLPSDSSPLTKSIGTTVCGTRSSRGSSLTLYFDKRNALIMFNESYDDPSRLIYGDVKGDLIKRLGAPKARRMGSIPTPTWHLRDGSRVEILWTVGIFQLMLMDKVVPEN